MSDDTNPTHPTTQEACGDTQRRLLRELWWALKTVDDLKRDCDAAWAAAMEASYRD